ncbi:MAG: restriction endonuclease subunit S, partial [Synergistaceae bacterium]|nr:restriction endonuclease subunit S [Synergistaceae bacterium]
MSKLDELIKELCPNGVEYKTLGEFATVIRGGNFQKKDFVERGKPCIHYGQMYTHFKNTTDKTLTFVSEEVFNKSKQAQPNDIIMAVTSENVDDVCSCVAWLGKENIAVSGHTAIIHHNQNPSYMSYYFHSEHFYKQKVKLAHGTKVIEVTPDKLLNLEIPVPPLPVQEEIVRILDTFTSLTAELTAELTARRKQYEYYRDALLTRKTKVEVKKLGELFDFRNGLSKGKEFFGRGIPFISFSDVYNHNSLHKSNIKALVDCSDDEKSKLHVGRGDVLFTRTSETAEDVGHSSVMLDDIGDCVFNGFTIRATPKTDKLVPEYCAYCFNTYSFRKYVTANCAFTTRASLTGTTLSEYELSFPPLDVQERIVNVLDNFDAICTDLKIGLPAEIEARKKQYEYYRDLLLTFASSGNTILS